MYVCPRPASSSSSSSSSGAVLQCYGYVFYSSPWSACGFLCLWPASSSGLCLCFSQLRRRGAASGRFGVALACSDSAKSVEGIRQRRLHSLLQLIPLAWTPCCGCCYCRWFWCVSDDGCCCCCYRRREVRLQLKKPPLGMLIRLLLMLLLLRRARIGTWSADPACSGYYAWPPLPRVQVAPSYPPALLSSSLAFPILRRPEEQLSWRPTAMPFLPGRQAAHGSSHLAAHLRILGRLPSWLVEAVNEFVC